MIDFNTKPSLDALRAFQICLIRKNFHCTDDMLPTIRAAQAEFDPFKRTAMVRSLLRRMHDDPPMLYMHETVMFDGVHKRVRNYKPVKLIINYHEIDIGE